MTIYQVQTTEQTKDFTPCTFIYASGRIFVEVPGDGFFEHPTFTKNSLKMHLARMHGEGFNIMTTEINY